MAFYSKDIDLYAKDAMLNYIRSQQTEFEVVQGKISALISESELEELEDGHTTMYSRLADVELRVDGFDAEFSQMDTKYNSVTGEITAMNSRLSTFSAGLNGLDSRITQTNTNLQNNYWTSTQTATEIQQSAESIMLQVSSGYASKSESVSGVVVEYAVGTSSTSAPTSGWSSNSPTWTSGKYIWQRTAITKNGNTTYSNVTCIQGAQGESGTSITISSIKYQQGDSATTAPTGTWSNDPVAVTQGKYLWTKTTYSNGSVAYAVSRQGVNGADGTSVSVSSVQYQQGDSPTTAPTGSWSNSPVTVEQGKYLWTKTTYSNSSVAYTVSRQGVDGAKGLNVATAYLYQRSASAPSKPSSDLTYTFSTGKLSGTLGNWSQAIPSGTNPCYVTIATASTTTATDTIPSSEWTAPVQLVANGTNGTNGIDGYNQATVFLYQRKSSVPSKPASAVTFNFSTGKLSSLPAGWTQTIPTANGNPCYVTTASAISQTSTAQILASAWSDVSKLAEDGQDGQNGAKGDDGVGISTVKAQYYLSSSKTAQSGGSWSDTPPEWVQGKYLWTRSHITYTDGTTSTTTPVLDQVNTDLEERMASAELKITADAIVSTVTNSEDMGSYVEQKADGIRLKAEKLVWQANNSSLDEYGNLTVTAGGSINAGSIYGGTLSLGGGTHGYSNMYMYDRNGNEIGSWTYLDGLEVKKGEITLEKYNSSDGSLEITSFSQGRIGYTYHADATGQSSPQFAGLSLSSQTTSGGVVTHPVYIYAMNNSKIVAQVVGNSNSASSVELVPYGQKDSYNGDNRFAVSGKAYFYSDLKVLGTKSRVTKTDDYGDRLFYCYETATPMFGDIGEGTIGEDGNCYIPLDPMFVQTVSCDQYQVFLQKYTDGTAYVSQREKAWFVVSGDPGVSFGWEVKAKQAGYEMMRMNNPDDYTDVVLSEYGRVGAEHIDQINEERSITS